MPQLSPETRSSHRALMGALIVVSIALLYLPLLHHQFIKGFDDDLYISENPHLAQGFSAQNLHWALTTTEPFYWHPITWLSHLLDYRLFGLATGPLHYENALWHALNALLIFLLLERATGARWRSFAVAMLFGLHPLNVQTVAWAAERKSILCLLMCLLTVAAHGWYASRPDWHRYLAVLAGMGLALACKPSAVILPPALLLLDYWPLERRADMAWAKRFAWLALEKLPLVIFGLGISAITVASESKGGTLIPLSMFPISGRIEMAMLAYITYAGKALWPAQLTAFHIHPALINGGHPPLADWLAASCLLFTLTGLMLWQRQRAVLIGWFFFLGTMLPTIGLIQTGYQGIAEHYTYVPAIGLFIALAWGAAALVEEIRLPRTLALGLLLCGLAVYGAATVQHLRSWQSGVTLFAEARERTAPPNYWIEMLYANALRFEGRVDDALPVYESSCRLRPDNEYCHIEIGKILLSRGQYRSALGEFQTALDYTQEPELMQICYNGSADALLHLSSFAAASEQLQHALQIDPQNAETERLRKKLASPLPAD